jgi:2-methylcitrate dehydratase PrpD
VAITPAATSGTALAAILGRFAAETAHEALPPIALERATMSLASTLASASCGHMIESTRIVRALESCGAGSGSAEVWFSGERLAPERAARVNAMASDSAASDDSDLRSIAHIGTIVTSVGLALAPTQGATGRELLAAMVLGYEIGGRIDEALTPGRNQRGFHGSASTIFAAGVTAARLLRADATQITHTIALCASSACGLTIAADTSWAREYHAGLAAMLGMQAACAAVSGFRSEPAVLESRRGFFEAFNGQAVEEVSRDLGSSWDIVTDMAIKLMPGGHPNHALAQAAIELAHAHDLKPEEIESVELSAPQLRQWSAGALRPADLIAAAHSLPYFIACALTDRRVGWDLFSNTKMQDPRVLSVIDRIRLDPSPSPWPDRFPHRHGGIVRVSCRDGRVLSHHCRAPLGSGPTGIEWDDVDAKYRALMPRCGLSPDRIEHSLTLIHQLGDSERIAPLLESLRLDGLGSSAH